MSGIDQSVRPILFVNVINHNLYLQLSLCLNIFSHGKNVFYISRYICDENLLLYVGTFQLLFFVKVLDGRAKVINK